MVAANSSEQEKFRDTGKLELVLSRKDTEVFIPFTDLYLDILTTISRLDK
jgi:hypothetical protein